MAVSTYCCIDVAFIVLDHSGHEPKLLPGVGVVGHCWVVEWKVSEV